MTKKDKIKLLVSSIAIIIPAVLALILNEVLDPKVLGAWHFSWIVPVVLVALQVVLHLLTFRENTRIEQNEKIVNITYWCLPAISLYISALFVMLSLGVESLIGILLSLTFGAIFIIFGNFMPKARRNRVFGLKIKWTLANDENWAATHRFTGKLWVIVGVVVLVGAFLPDTASIILLLASIIPAVVVPILYSYCYYKKQLSDGTATAEDFKAYHKHELDKKSTKASIVIGSLVVALVVLLMFVGSITFTVGDDALEVKTTYGGKMSIAYTDIERVECSPERVDGMRVSGFASAKLLYGWFKNDELGNYTRYTYGDSEVTVIIYTKDGIVVLADETDEATWALYEAISDKIMGD